MIFIIITIKINLGMDKKSVFSRRKKHFFTVLWDLTLFNHVYQFP
ncbi:hypothetical protein FB545_2453 [Peribacillus frigoritolerans]|nr:hypothetical protein FB545_2453 [Peribacillus frigoritolerans]